MKNPCLFILFLAVAVNASAQAPSIQWQKSLGGTAADVAFTMQKTSGGGYIVAGYSWSVNGDVTGNHGLEDYWVVKLNDTGHIQWQKSYGGSNHDQAKAIQQTADGGYIVAGQSVSVNGDVSGNHGGNDYWVVKLNDTGGIQWQKSLGGTGDESANAIQQTADGGYIVAGYSNSNNGNVSGNHGLNDYWVVKLNDTGAVQWQKSLGGSNADVAHSVRQTLDGGYIVAGQSMSNDGNVSGNHGSDDDWIVKLNDTGAIEWQKSFGGSSPDVAYSILQTSDSGYIVAGTTGSNDSDVTLNRGNTDFWIIKLTNSGAKQWQKTLGGSGYDNAYTVHQLSDGYIVAGESNSNDSEVSGNHGNTDYWIVKLNDTGAIEWQKSLGGSDADGAYAIWQTADGGYTVAGYIASTDGDVSGNHGGYDYWITKLTCGLHAGSITGLSTICLSTTISLTDTASGGVWSVTNSNAAIAGGVVTPVSSGSDTAIYTVTNSCGTVTTSFPFTITPCPSLEINVPVNTSPVTLRPNPTTGSISITGAGVVNIKVYNPLGQLMKQANNTDDISISEFPAGLYFVRVFNEQGALIKQDKIIKQ